LLGLFVCCLFNVAVSKRFVAITAVYTKFQIFCGIAPCFEEACYFQLQGVIVLNLTTYCWLSNAHSFSSANYSSQIQKKSSLIDCSYIPNHRISEFTDVLQGSSRIHEIPLYKGTFLPVNDMNAYGWRRIKVPLVFNLGTRWW
jgi:hypothetical protein